MLLRQQAALLAAALLLAVASSRAAARGSVTVDAQSFANPKLRNLLPLRSVSGLLKQAIPTEPTRLR